MVTEFEPTPLAHRGITDEKAPAAPPATSSVKLSGVKAEWVIAEPDGLGPGGIDPNPHSVSDRTAVSYRKSLTWLFVQPALEIDWTCSGQKMITM